MPTSVTSMQQTRFMLVRPGQPSARAPMPVSMILLQLRSSMPVRPGQLAARVNKSSFAMSSRMTRQRLGNRLATCTAKSLLVVTMQSIVVTDGGSRACKLQQVDIVLTTALVGSQDTAWKRGPSGISRKQFFECRRESLPFEAIFDAGDSSREDARASRRKEPEDLDEKKRDPPGGEMDWNGAYERSKAPCAKATSKTAGTGT